MPMADASMELHPPAEEYDMNSLPAEKLSEYLDPEYFDATIDTCTLSLDQFQLAEKEKIEPAAPEDIEEASNEQDPTTVLTPREYQFELYRKALEENVIAVLGTGSGKTLISVMLIKEMAWREREERLLRRKVKLCFFLVDRVPLVFQQSDVIRANCDVSLIHLCGQMNVDSWLEKDWRLAFEEHDVCVLTAQIFLDALRHGYISMDRVFLLIFDEAHHAIKKHPYNLIMREFYDRCPVEDRPKIFGMTASPMRIKTGVESSVKQLERCLDARAYTATRDSQVQAVLKPPREVSLGYDLSPAYPLTELTKVLQQRLGSMDIFHRCFSVARYIHEQFGPYCCDIFWLELLETKSRLADEIGGIDVKSLHEAEQAARDSYEQILESVPRNLSSRDSDVLSPKVQVLLRTLDVMRNREDFSGIVFVERRYTAVVLSRLIQYCSFLDHINCSYLTGHGSKDDGNIQMCPNRQNRVIIDFRKRRLNLLVATNVAEEGLDLRACNVVIRFDMCLTPTSYIQSRGRARQENSVYVILIPNDDTIIQRKLNEYREQEQKLVEFCRANPDIRNVTKNMVYGMDEIPGEDSDDTEYRQSRGTLMDVNGYDDDDLDDDDDDDFTENMYIVPSTLAVVTKQSSVPLLCRYCSCLPSDSYCVLKPVFELSESAGGFMCTVKLPNNASIPQAVSEPSRTKRSARALAALQACIELHRAGSLTDHLLPKVTPSSYLGEMKDEYDEAGHIIGSRRRRVPYEKRTPAFWEKDVEEDNELEEPDEPMANQPIKEDDQLEAGAASDIVVNGLAQGVNEITVKDTSSPCESSQILDSPNDTTMDSKITQDNLPRVLYSAVIDMELDGGMINGIPLRRLCLLTWKPFPILPPLTLYVRNNPMTIQVRPFGKDMEFSEEDMRILADFNLKMVSSMTNKGFSCELHDFPYFIAPLQRDAPLVAKDYFGYLDWAEMRSATLNDTLPVSFEDFKVYEDAIVIDYSDNHRRYYVTRVCSDLNPFSPIPTDEKMRETGLYDTFAAFYEDTFEKKVTRPDQPMIRVRRVNKVANYLFPHIALETKVHRRTATFVIPEFCSIFPVSASLYQTMTVIPSIMTRIDSFLLAREAKERYQLDIEDTLMLEAYTTPSANMSMNYERLETLGDSLLKFLATIRLFVNFPLSDEGELHCLRIRVICNRALYRAAKKLKLFRYVTSHAFNRRYWRPHHFVAKTDTPDTLIETKTHILSDKTLADIVEASLGAAYQSSGLEGGLQCAISMKVPFDDIVSWKDFLPAYRRACTKMPPRAQMSALNNLDIRRIEEIAGYTFKTPLLVVEALTHASLPSSSAPCYQRLEFLGDAILDFLVIEYLYTKYPGYDPGKMTEIKGACVNNQILGVVCHETGLHRHIVHSSSVFVNALNDFEKSMTGLKEQGLAEGEYWMDLIIPKVLSDVVESMLGAVFVDAEFSFDAAKALFYRWMVPFLDQYVSPESIRPQPSTLLTHYLQRYGCDEFMLRNHTTSSTGPGSQKCVIFLHNKPLACGSGENIKAARRNAASRALKRLNDSPEILDMVCVCRPSNSQDVPDQDSSDTSDIEDNEDAN